MFDIAWDDAIVVIFFIYGLAFYSMGLALWIESGRASELGFARSMRLLAAFGLLHGLHEWMDMIEQGSAHFFETSVPDWWLWPRLVLLSISFAALLAFGEQLLDRERYGRASSWFRTWGAIALFAIAAVGVQVSYDLDDVAWARAIEVLARYTMGIPGIILTAYRNLGGEVSEKLIETAISRGRGIAGGFCGFMGVCGAAVGVGIAYSLLLDANPIKARERKQVQGVTQAVLAEIARFKAARCCQRDGWIALNKAAELSAKLLPVALSVNHVLRCMQSSQNAECLGPGCPLHPGGRSLRAL